MKVINDKDFKIFVIELKRQYAEVLQEVTIINNTDECPIHLYITTIKIKNKYRGMGWGSKILTDIVQFADRHNVQVQLYASDILGSDLRGLYKFYRRNKFVLIKDNKFVHRPKKIGK